MKHKIIIKQLIMTELFLDAACPEEALEVGNELLANDMIPVSDYHMQEGSVEVELLEVSEAVSSLSRLS